MLATGLLTGPAAGRGTASNHIDAPGQILDHQVDVTDMYLFTSPDDPDTVTAITDWTAFETPRGLLPFHRFVTEGYYEFHIDNTGDGKPEFTYRWTFKNDNGQGDPPPAKAQMPAGMPRSTVPWAPHKVLESAGSQKVTPVDDQRRASHRPSGQSYGLELIRPGKPTEKLVSGVRTADWDLAGRRSTAAVKLPGGRSTYAGPNRDPFFFIPPTNVHSIALKLPKKEIALNNDPVRNPVIGMWSNAYRKSFSLGSGKPTYRQVSRQGLSGFSSVVLPIQLRDKYHFDSSPATDPQWKAMNDWVETGATGSLFGIAAIPVVRPVLTSNKHLKQIFLYGIGRSTGPVKQDLNAHSLNVDADKAKIMPSEQLRLNMSIPHNRTPSRHGFLNGDRQGYPNGRRLTDDTFTAFARITLGEPAAPPLLGITALLPVSGIGAPRNEGFPYLFPPI